MSSLQGLLQVSGVIGAFVCGDGAGLVARNLPAVFADSMLEEADRVVARLGRGLEGHGGCTRVALAFSEIKLFVRPLAGARLYVVCEPRTNLAYLELAVHSTVQSLNEELAARESAVSEDAGRPSLVETKRRIRELVERELGSHATRAVSLLDQAGDGRAEIGEACDRVERLVYLFISRPKSREMAGAMEALLMEAEG